MAEGTGRSQRFCPHCGTRARTDAAFCVSCGGRMEGGDGRGRTGRAAYGGGRHLELAQSAYRRSREAYQGAKTLPTSSVVVGYVLVCLALVLAQVLFLPTIITYFVFAVLTLGLGMFGLVRFTGATGKGNRRSPARRFGGLTAASKAVIAGATVLLLLFALLAPGASTVVSLCLFGIAFVAVVALLSLQRPVPKVLSSAFLVSFSALIVSVAAFGISESVNPYDAAGTDVLDSMVRGGMVDSDENIVAVEVRGEEATIVISSDAPGGYAESVCDFALGSAREFDNQAGIYEDYIGITQITVREEWRPWSAASCAL